MTERKRRKWDVAAPQGIPLAGNRAGIGAGSTASSNGMAGLITAQGVAAVAGQAAIPGVAPPKPGQPLDANTIARAQQGAAAIVAKLNQELAAQGKLPQGRGGFFKKPEEDIGIFRPVTINDAPPEMRHHLTKRPTQDDIARRTGTQIVTRGRYMAPGMPQSDTEQPLYLFITPGASASENDAEKQRCVDMAAAEIQGILQGQRVQKGGPYQPASQRAFNAVGPPQQAYNMQPPAPGVQPYGAVPPAAASGQYPGAAVQYGQPGVPPGLPPGVQSASLWVRLEAAPEFNLCQRLKGPNNGFLDHIAKETGATVALRGRGSGTQEAEPLHIFVSSALPKAFADASKLAQNLIDTVRAEHAKAYPYPPSGGPPAAAGVPPAYGAGPPPYGTATPYGAGPYGYPLPTAAPYGYPSPGAAPYGQPAGGYGPPYGAPNQAPPPGAYGTPPGYGPPANTYGQRPPAFGPGQLHPQGQSYPPPYQAPPGPYSQQSPYGYPPPNSSATPGASGGATPSGSGSSGTPNQMQQQQQLPSQASVNSQQQQSEGEQQRRKRFREFKEERQEPLQPPPYYAPPPDVQQSAGGGAASAQAPAAARQQQVMGPPPPRQLSAPGFTPMGPPPPRAPAGSAGGRDLGSAGGGLMGGLVDYGDED
ncbi:g11367 [Coccomyxa elongata]